MLEETFMSFSCCKSGIPYNPNLFRQPGVLDLLWIFQVNSEHPFCIFTVIALHFGLGAYKRGCKGIVDAAYQRNSDLEYYMSQFLCTDRKENQNFPIYKEIQNGAVAKSYITNGLLIYGEIFPHFLIYRETLPHI
jgi:hypothetical protein